MSLKPNTHYVTNNGSRRIYVASDHSVWDVTPDPQGVPRDPQISDMPDDVSRLNRGKRKLRREDHESAARCEALVEDPTIHHRAGSNAFNYLRGRGMRVISAISRDADERDQVPRNVDYALLDAHHKLVGTACNSPAGLRVSILVGGILPNKVGRGRPTLRGPTKKKITLSVTPAEFTLVAPALDDVGRLRAKHGTTLRVDGVDYPREGEIES